MTGSNGGGHGVRPGELRMGKRHIPFLVLEVGDPESEILLGGERMRVTTQSLAFHSWRVDIDSGGADSEEGKG